MFGLVLVVILVGEVCYRNVCGFRIVLDIFFCYKILDLSCLSGKKIYYKN